MRQSKGRENAFRDDQKNKDLLIFSPLALKEPPFSHLMANTTQRHILLWQKQSYQ